MGGMDLISATPEGRALEIIASYGGIDGGHHKQWVLDQVVRALTGCPTVKTTIKLDSGEDCEYGSQGESANYIAWVEHYEDGEDGPETYEWDTGIAP